MHTTFTRIPEPPDYAAIFTSQRTGEDARAGAVADRRVEPVSRQPGFLGVESVRDAAGARTTVSCWSSLHAIAARRAHAEHGVTQTAGRRQWSSHVELRVARVERASSGP